MLTPTRMEDILSIFLRHKHTIHKHFLFHQLLGNYLLVCSAIFTTWIDEYALHISNLNHFTANFRIHNLFCIWFEWKWLLCQIQIEIKSIYLFPLSFFGIYNINFNSIKEWLKFIGSFKEHIFSVNAVISMQWYSTKDPITLLSLYLLNNIWQCERRRDYAWNIFSNHSDLN